MLVPLESSSAVLVMISNKSVSIILGQLWTQVASVHHEYGGLTLATAGLLLWQVIQKMFVIDILLKFADDTALLVPEKTDTDLRLPIEFDTSVARPKIIT